MRGMVRAAQSDNGCHSPKEGLREALQLRCVCTPRQGSPTHTGSCARGDLPSHSYYKGHVYIEEEIYSFIKYKWSQVAQTKFWIRKVDIYIYMVWKISETSRRIDILHLRLVSVYHQRAVRLLSSCRRTADSLPSDSWQPAFIQLAACPQTRVICC